MPNGLMQLVAYGAQDLYLTGNPKMTYFKFVYRRHTNFAMEYINLEFETKPPLGLNNKFQGKVKIDRHADLIHDCYLCVDFPEIYAEYISGFKWIKYLGYNLIHYVTLTINGVEIDKQYGDWLIIWNELILSDAKKRNLYNMINVDERIYNYKEIDWVPTTTTVPGDTLNSTKKCLLYKKKRLYIPLLFWFCTNPGLALPLISLQYSEVYINFEFNELNNLFTLSQYNLSESKMRSDQTNGINLFNTNQQITQNFIAQDYFNKLFNQNSNNTLLYFIGKLPLSTISEWNPNIHVIGNYIYLDDDERELFSKYTQEYLIMQTQRFNTEGLKTGAQTVELKFNHTIKELIWGFYQLNRSDFNDYTNYTYLNYNDKQTLQNIKNIEIDDYTILQQQFNEYLFGQSGLFINPQINRKNNSNSLYNIMEDFKLKINGKDRFVEQEYGFFENLEQFKYNKQYSNIKEIYNYSFALNPNDIQPSGTCNFSRLNKVELLFNLRMNYEYEDLDIGEAIIFPEITNSQKNSDLNKNTTGHETAVLPNIDQQYGMFIYGTNYNILRIMGGLGTIAFAN
uniref:Major capsid protein N-terminal domain-containing protein n=1 Tax=viral metagenome TaxID=1070528 RepID=A0A6C0J7B0_9ZZZZ